MAGTELDARSLPALAQEIGEQVCKAEQAWSDAVGHAIRAGELLIAAKRRVPHGGWGQWVKANFPGSERTAQNYMRLARNPQRVADLPSIRDAVARLTAPKRIDTPAEGNHDGDGGDPERRVEPEAHRSAAKSNGSRAHDPRSLVQKRAEQAIPEWKRDEQTLRLVAKVNGAAFKMRKQEAELLAAIERCRDRYAVLAVAENLTRSMGWIQVHVDAARDRIAREGWSA